MGLRWREEFSAAPVVLARLTRSIWGFGVAVIVLAHGDSGLRLVGQANPGCLYSTSSCYCAEHSEAASVAMQFLAADV